MIHSIGNDDGEQSQEWNDLDSIMSSILSSHENQCSADAATAKVGIALLDDIAAHSSRLQTSSRRISDSITAEIKHEKTALSEESNELSRQSSRVQSLQSQISKLEQTNGEMRTKRRAAEEAIPHHLAVASEQISEMDQLESRHVKKLTKNKHELSLHALVTNIKWDYAKSTSDVLAGEVSIPGRSIHKRFEIEKDDGQYEIAERLWDMIGG